MTAREFLHANKRRIFVALKAGIGLGLLAVIFRHIGWENVARLLKSTDIGQFAIACLLLALGIGGHALRWNEVMRVLRPPLGIKPALIGTFEAMFLNQVLPSSIGGDGLRALRSYDQGATPGQALLGVLIDRALGLWFVAGVVLAAFLVRGSAIVPSLPFKVLAAISAVVFFGAILAVLLGRFLTKERVPRWAGPIVTLLAGFSIVARDRLAVLRLIVIMAVSTGFIALALQRCGYALGLSIGLWDTLIVLQGMLLASVIPLSIGGWGWREGAALLLLAAAGVGPPEATSLSVLFGLALTVIGLCGAIVWMLAGYQRFDRRLGLKGLQESTRQGAERP